MFIGTQNTYLYNLMWPCQQATVERDEDEEQVKLLISSNATRTWYKPTANKQPSAHPSSGSNRQI